MEGKEYEFDIFSDINYIENLYNVLPFNTFDEVDDKNDIFDILNIDFTSSWTEKHTGNSEQIIDKLNKLEENYNNIVNTNIVSSPTTSKKILTI
jgi:hypothetical protein